MPNNGKMIRSIFRTIQPIVCSSEYTTISSINNTVPTVILDFLWFKNALRGSDSYGTPSLLPSCRDLIGASRKLKNLDPALSRGMTDNKAGTTPKGHLLGRF